MVSFLNFASVAYNSIGTIRSQLSKASFICIGVHIFSKASKTLGLKSIDFSIASSIVRSIFDLKSFIVGLIKYVIGMDFPITSVVGLSFQSNDLNSVLVFNFQLDKVTSLTKVMFPFKLNSRIVYKEIPNLSVPILYFTVVFKGKIVVILPSVFLIDIGANFQIFISISSSSMVLSSYIKPFINLLV